MLTLVKDKNEVATTGPFHGAVNNAPAALFLSQKEVRKSHHITTEKTDACKQRVSPRTQVRSES